MIDHRQALLILIAGLTAIQIGCTTPKTSNTARTAVEQLLISNAVDQSLNKVDFEPFRGQTVHLSEAYIEAVDKPYIVGSVRHRLLAAGARLVDKPEDAQVILEVRSGGVGTSTSNTFIGVPEVALPGMMTIPELKFAERSQQTGLAKIGLVAYDARTGEVLGSGGVSLSQSTDSNWFVGGMGPVQRGSIRDEVQRSTTGAAAMQQTQVPPQVAFSSAPHSEDSADEDSNIQFASGSEPASE